MNERVFKMYDLAFAIPSPSMGSRILARTSELERCLALNAKVILMLDSDQTFPSVFAFPEGVDLILANEIDLYVFDAPNKDAQDTNVYYNPDGTLDYFTISCCLIRPDFLRGLPKPWFRSDLAYILDGVKEGKNIYRLHDKHTDDDRGEDVYFSKLCLANGARVTIDKVYKSKHMSTL